MSLSTYTGTRIFQSPFLRRTETVGGGAVIGALLGGPFYYWKKQAPVEAVVLFTAELVLFLLSNQAINSNAIDSTMPSLILWLVSAFAAPVLLPMCYLRKGWIEIAPI
ncbi:MAG TPA: hypothetical protein VH020_09160 [Stellaceae bacterium]|jgi:hypothetical protein|nr:hypothetical protein [Stellaceae bacterium]